MGLGGVGHSICSYHKAPLRKYYKNLTRDQCGSNLSILSLGAGLQLPFLYGSSLKGGRMVCLPPSQVKLLWIFFLEFFLSTSNQSPEPGWNIGIYSVNFDRFWNWFTRPYPKLLTSSKPSTSIPRCISHQCPSPVWDIETIKQLFLVLFSSQAPISIPLWSRSCF